MFDYGKAIQKARKNKGWTQEQLADAIQVKRAVISKYENGQVEPSVSRFKDIAMALDVKDWSELATGQAIVDHLKGEIAQHLSGKKPPQDPQMNKEENLQSHADKPDTAGIAMQKYLMFAINHSYLMALIEAIGIRILFVDAAADKIKICRGNIEREVSLSDFVNDLEAMHTEQENNLKNMFARHYGIDF